MGMEMGVGMLATGQALSCITPEPFLLRQYGFDCYDVAMDLPTKAKAHACFEELTDEQREAIEQLPTGGGW